MPVGPLRKNRWSRTARLSAGQRPGVRYVEGVRTRILQVRSPHTPWSLAAALPPGRGLILLESAGPWATPGRFSYLAADPMVEFRSAGACGLVRGERGQELPVYGNPWRVLEAWLERYELSPEADLPLPAGFCAGYWGYELRQFVEPKLRPHPAGDLSLPHCWAGFFDSLVAFDHDSGGVWIVSTGLRPDGSRSERRRDARVDHWRRWLETEPLAHEAVPLAGTAPARPDSLDDAAFQERVERALRYIRQGDIYQVNLARRWTVAGAVNPRALYQALSRHSPAPYAAYLESGDFAVVSSSPELFLRLDGVSVQTRPIKGTRPRGATPGEDAALAQELRASAKERAELTMITDLLRNDLGKVCSFGSVRVPELMRLEVFSQVQHLVSTVEGRLRAGVSHLAALEACFPGGSITGAPKFRAMQIIDELEPVGRGPYTGALGYLGFNRLSQLSLIIRAAFSAPEATWYYAGAGIVADSDPAAECAETWAKARGFLECLDNGGAEIQTLSGDDVRDRGAKDADKDAHGRVCERRAGSRGRSAALGV